MKSVLMIGQSNMAGRGFINDVPMICNERIQMLRNGKWQTMCEPINYDRPVAGVSLAGSFAAMWCHKNAEDSIGLIPCAEGGSSLDDWSVDKTLFQNALAQAKFAMQESDLIGFIWHQGENDSFGGNYQTYYEKLKVIVDTFRKELNTPELPFILGGLGDYLGKSGFGRNCTEYSLVNDEIQRFAMNQDNCYFVTAKNLSANPDGIHLNAISLRQFGVRYYEAFSQLKHVLSPLENELCLLDDCLHKPYTDNEELFLSILDFSLGKITYEQFDAKLASKS